jgi:Mn2+/Fe2+ NRAMP family transporter
MTQSPRSIRTGAAFLMAVSAIGPGFLTQTTQFTAQLGASLAFAILLSILIDVGAQLNTWRVICVSRKRGNEVADAVVPGLGYLVTAVIVAGSFIFNLGNLSGCALGLEALFGLNQTAGIIWSALLAIALFMLPAMLTGVDWFTKVLGALMIVVTFYLVFVTQPPLDQAVLRAVYPEEIDVGVIVTLIGGTIGGYIMFSGAHRLLDGGIAGPEHLREITAGSVMGIVITGVMRLVLFLAILGVVTMGASLSPERPVFDAFEFGAGGVGRGLAGLVFWAAAITSVVGCSYTSISFFNIPAGSRRRASLIVTFIVLSMSATLALRGFGWPATKLLIFAGLANGLLLPVLLAVVLIAGRRRGVMGDYRQPLWATALGALALAATVFMAGFTIYRMLG